MYLLIQWVATVIAIALSAYILPGVLITDFPAAIFAGLVLSLINIFIRPLLLILTLPISVVTLGLFVFVLNGLMIMLAAWLVPGFAVANIWWAILMSVILSIVTAAFYEADSKGAKR